MINLPPELITLAIGVVGSGGGVGAGYKMFKAKLAQMQEEINELKITTDNLKACDARTDKKINSMCSEQKVFDERLTDLEKGADMQKEQIMRIEQDASKRDGKIKDNQDSLQRIEILFARMQTNMENNFSFINTTIKQILNKLD